MSRPGWSKPQSIDRDRIGFLTNRKNWVLRSIALSWCSTAGKGSRDYRFARQRVTHAVRADMFPNDIAA
jgi:hypothetical protein